MASTSGFYICLPEKGETIPRYGQPMAVIKAVYVGGDKWKVEAPPSVASRFSTLNLRPWMGWKALRPESAGSARELSPEEYEALVRQSQEDN